MNRGQDSLMIYQLNKLDDSQKLVYSETQKTWIDLDEASRIEFLESGKGFILNPIKMAGKICTCTT